MNQQSYYSGSTDWLQHRERDTFPQRIPAQVFNPQESNHEGSPYP